MASGGEGEGAMRGVSSPQQLTVLDAASAKNGFVAVTTWNRVGWGNETIETSTVANLGS